MPKRGDMELLEDIKEAIKRIEFYTGKMSYEQFLQDIKTQDAVVRNIEIIGEATKNVSDKLKKNSPQIPWKKMAGVRDRLIHHYFGVNYDVVWAIAKKELPEVNKHIKKVLSAI